LKVVETLSNNESVKDGSLHTGFSRLVEMYNHLLCKEQNEDTAAISSLVARISEKEELKRKNEQA
jgi:hypothetical protein